MYLKLKDIHTEEREVNDAFIKRQKNKHFKTSHEIPILRTIIRLNKTLIQYLGGLSSIALILAY